MQNPAYANQPAVAYLPPPPPGEWGVGMQSFASRYEINPKFTP